MNEGDVLNGHPRGHDLVAAPSNCDTHDLAISLDPVLHAACGGRLGPIEWFRASWQRGGAATGFSTWTMHDGSRIGVLVKFPVGPCEYRWTTCLGTVHPEDWHAPESVARATPRVLAAGQELGGYDLAWIVTERLHGPTLSSNLTEESLLDLLRAAADFQCAALKASPVGERPTTPLWERTLEHSREVAKAGGVPEAQRWNDMIKRVQRSLPALRARWESRHINAWCHGDLHPGNALRRPGPESRANPASGRGCVLIDLALVHPGHWVEDALYLERQFWGHGEMLHGVKPVSMLAKFRKERGLPADDQYGELATVRRVLMAACAPALIEREGNPKYLHAALELIERFLPQAAK
jgi:hypothetical protein